MKKFAALYTALDETTATNEKVAALVEYFRTAEPQDAAWAVHFLSGRRPKRLISTRNLRTWAAEEAGLRRMQPVKTQDVQPWNLRHAADDFSILDLHSEEHPERQDEQEAEQELGRK